MVTKSIENAQKKVEAHNFNIRKHVLEYDDVMNTQREVMYSQRRSVLENENLKDSIMGMIAVVVDRLLDIYAAKEIHPEEWNLKGLSEYLVDIFQVRNVISKAELEELSREGCPRYFGGKGSTAYGKKKKN